MKLSRLLFLLPAVSTVVADLAPNPVIPTQSALAQRDVTNANGEVVGASKAGSKGTLDAPVDGYAGNKETEQGKPVKGREKFDATVSSAEGAKKSNNGVTGAEKDMSEKQLGVKKVPEGPKEAPPLPYSEQKKALEESAGGKGTKGVPAKPSTPPETYDVATPKSATSSKDTYTGTKGTSSKSKLELDEQPAADPLHSLVFSFTMIIVSEIGDKTFLVAALMAMRHPRLLVFSAAFSALIGMTVLSAILGHGIPTLIPKTFTKFMAALLFFIFGLKMVKEGREMSPDEGVGEEMKEVEMELEEKEQEQIRLGRRRSSVTPHSLEAGRGRSSKNRMPSPPESLSSSSSRESSPSPGRRWNDMLVGLNNLFSLLLSPAWVQTFAMTFLGEWGDRSQIATIAMAAGQDYWWVTVGAATGHGICTAAAVIGGSAIAGKVSMRVVTLGGATAFLVFGVIYLIEALYE
ncbi:TMEM165/GDT1 family protein [Aspergillus ruber CBS 135680]|uniref:UPF0016-domain-containing protein n=1 Tax=Aspergillus ruber (strain CBS 135680) TaxID=1388766 RepID=A0A017SGQ9_ASPRC|nr:UPF0016-domain-containing protein [Aspergillus ruber CBS 135680]EYE96122.1 UPF0016-domain-containing protein [Aspergillus ruber CBS 135680]